MFVKVKISGKNAVVYELNRSEVLIGTGATAHLIIHDPGLSKKHIKLFSQGKDWFVVDQGSTNGSYLGEEKLIPGKSYALNFDIDLKLGHQVFIAILVKADGAQPIQSSHQAVIEQIPLRVSDQDKTQIISLEDFKAAKLLAEKEKKREFQLKRAALVRKKKEDQNKIATSLIIGLLIIAFGIFANRAWRASKNKIKKDTIVNRLKTKMKGDQEIDTDILGYRISRNVLISRNRINTFKNSMRCTDSELLDFCSRGGSFLGTHREGENLIFFADEKLWRTKASLLPMNLEKNEPIFRKIIFLLVLKREFSQFSSAEKRNIYVAFYREDANQMKYLSFVGAVDINIVPLLNEKFKEDKVDGEEQDVLSMTNDLDQFYTLY